MKKQKRLVFAPPVSLNILESKGLEFKQVKGYQGTEYCDYLGNCTKTSKILHKSLEVRFAFYKNLFSLSLHI